MKTLPMNQSEQARADALAEVPDVLPSRIKLHCPCGCAVPSAILYRYAVDAIDRECPQCHALWRIILRPIKTGRGIAIHQVEWTCTRGGREFRVVLPKS